MNSDIIMYNILSNFYKKPIELIKKSYNIKNYLYEIINNKIHIYFKSSNYDNNRHIYLLYNNPGINNLYIYRSFKNVFKLTKNDRLDSFSVDIFFYKKYYRYNNKRKFYYYNYNNRNIFLYNITLYKYNYYIYIYKEQYMVFIYTYYSINKVYLIYYFLYIFF